jgi:hypothetical protein
MVAGMTAPTNPEPGLGRQVAQEAAQLLADQRLAYSKIPNGRELDIASVLLGLTSRMEALLSRRQKLA